MFQLFAIAGLAALLTACAAPSSSVDDPMHQSRGSTPTGASKAAMLGFHGPVDRGVGADAP